MLSINEAFPELCGHLRKNPYLLSIVASYRMMAASALLRRPLLLITARPSASL